MIRSKQNGDSSSDEVYDEDQIGIETQQQKKFHSQCGQLHINSGNQASNQKPKDKDKIHQLYVPKPIQMMFILYSYYQDDLINIVKTTLNRIKIQSQNSDNDVQKCYKKMEEYLAKLAYLQLQHQNRYKILHCPRFNKKAQERNFRMCKFNDKVYAFSNAMSQKTLQSKLKDLASSQLIFTVDIKSPKSKNRQIYAHLRQFIKIMMNQYADQFKKRSIIVEIDKTQCRICCIGNIQRDLVAVKNMMKNLLQSTIIFIVKFEPQFNNVDEKVTQLKGFVKKNVGFPVYISKVQKRIITIISKQNIIRKLIDKKKVIQILDLYKSSQPGVFLPRRYNFQQRKIMIEDMCVQRGYDFNTLGGIYHLFKKMFLHQGEVIDPKQLPQLIHDVFEAIKQNKQRFDVPQHFDNIKKQKVQLEITTGQYYSTGQVLMDQNLTKILKSNVLRQKLKMSKNALVKYKVFQGEQSQSIYWYLDKQQNKIECKIQEMKPGIQYFNGKYKFLGSQKVYFIAYKIKIM